MPSEPPDEKLIFIWKYLYEKKANDPIPPGSDSSL